MQPGEEQELKKAYERDTEPFREAAKETGKLYLDLLKTFITLGASFNGSALTVLPALVGFLKLDTATLHSPFMSAVLFVLGLACNVAAFWYLTSSLRQEGIAIRATLNEEWNKLQARIAENSKTLEKDTWRQQDMRVTAWAAAEFRQGAMYLFIFMGWVFFILGIIAASYAIVTAPSRGGLGLSGIRAP